MITVEKFLQCVDENAQRVTHYQSGGDGTGGGCDCIGQIIGALRLAGEQWNGTHGSNWAARNAIQELYPMKITSESELQPGMIVFKAHAPGDSGYSLPDSYKKGNNLMDYYHVGVVTHINPLTITHCTKNLSQGIDGITEDHSLGKWEYYAMLKDVAYPGYEWRNDILYYARVYAANGQPVRLRPEPNTDRKEITKVGVNTVVAVLDDSISGWDKVEYTGIKGYMKREFLAPINDVQRQEPSLRQNDAKNDGGKVTVERSRVEAVCASLINAAETLKGLMEG